MALRRRRLGMSGHRRRRVSLSRITLVGIRASVHRLLGGIIVLGIGGGSHGRLASSYRTRIFLVELGIRDGALPVVADDAEGQKGREPTHQ